jgi:hypothetical protein
MLTCVANYERLWFGIRVSEKGRDGVTVQEMSHHGASLKVRSGRSACATPTGQNGADSGSLNRYHHPGAVVPQ